METKRIKEFIKKHRRPFLCIRLLLVYVVFLCIAKCTGVFNTEITKSRLHAFVALVIMIYRFLSISFVPAILVLWFFDQQKQKHSKGIN